MWPFRRRREETLNEQLLREAGLDGVQDDEPAPPEPAPEPADPYAGTSDVLTTAEAPGLPGDAVEFAALPSGDLVFVGDVGDADLSPLAEAVERELKPPYRAHGRRQVTVDGEPSHGTVPDLDEQGRAVGVDYVVRAERLDGDLWEVTADPL
jgi:hypothetical protein